MSWDLKLFNTNRIYWITTDVKILKQFFHDKDNKIKKICLLILEK